ncbi:MAG: transglycosylase SLT domain-containing protein [Acidobacteria bacterium]|nr:transglycosylase SLT domain-containing protein [Acidobacteriota bacterium]
MTRGLSLTLACVVLLLPSAQARSAEIVFPTDGFEQRIAFWTKVFTEYGQDDVVVHDRFHVNLIYGVADESGAKAMVRRVEAALSDLAAHLDEPEMLGPDALETRAAIVAEGLVPSVPLLATLRDRVHTQRGVKERFRGGVIRSGRYVEAFSRIMLTHDVPEDLALLPLVESSYQNVRSKAAAVGVWQFTRGTGRQYLRIRGRIDERLDPMKAANAAARLLRDNYDALGTWPLALTAYNHGRAGMLRAKAAHGADLATIVGEYDGPVFGYASMNFYAEFLAAVHVYRNRDEYFGPLTLDPPVGAPGPTVVTVASTPKQAGQAAAAGPRTYRVRRGDTLIAIAQRFGTSVRDLMSLNELAHHTIYAGQMLFIR